MKKKPLIIVAPHAATSVPDSVRDRIALSDYEIWRFGDPFTDETAQHPDAFAVITSKASRVLCDVSHGPRPVKPFRDRSFYGKPIFKPGQEFSKEERAKFLQQHAKVYRRKIRTAVESLVNSGEKKIVLIDHHNTASEHPVGATGDYMPLITFGNGGVHDTGKEADDDEVYSCPAEVLKTMQKVFKKQTTFPAEINHIYRQSHTIRWLMNDVAPQYADVEFYGIFIEYDLSFIHNPLSRYNDEKAKHVLHTAINACVDAALNELL